MIAPSPMRLVAVLGLALAAGACNFLPDRDSADSRYVDRHAMTEEQLVAANAEHNPPAAAAAPAPARHAEVTQASLDAPDTAKAEEDDQLANTIAALDSMGDEDASKDVPGI